MIYGIGVDDLSKVKHGGPDHHNTLLAHLLCMYFSDFFGLHKLYDFFVAVTMQGKLGYMFTGKYQYLVYSEILAFDRPFSIKVLHHIARDAELKWFYECFYEDTSNSPIV